MRVDLSNYEDVSAGAIGNCLTDDFFSSAFCVHLGRVDERHSKIDAKTECGNLRLTSRGIFTHLPCPLTENRHGPSRRQERGSYFSGAVGLFRCTHNSPTRYLSFSLCFSVAAKSFKAMTS